MRLPSVAALVVGAVIVGRADAQVLPALPQTFLDTAYPTMSGQSTLVPAGGNLQTAINAAQPGDTILLGPGATYSGSFTLPVKTGTGWIIIRTSAPDSSLPPEGTRITPAYEAVMPKIVATNIDPAVQTELGAHHYRFVGVEFTLAAGVTTNGALVVFGGGADQTSLSQVAYALVLDRVYVHGNATANLYKGVALNCGAAAVIDSYISEAHVVGGDAQAIAGWNGPGPFKIVNNYLEGAGENIIFGGADPWIPNMVPSDIEVRGNHVYKPLRWRVGDPTYAGIPWSVKNLFELKNARRVLIEGNVFENNWLDAQIGYAIPFTVRNQDGRAPWSVVEDITFTNNIVRHTAAGMNITGYDNNYPSQQTKRILIRNNLFEDIDGPKWGGGPGTLFIIGQGTADVVVDHNTGIHSGSALVADGAPNTGFVYRNNLTPHNLFGVIGTDTGIGIGTLNTYFPGAVFARNVLAGGNPAFYPPDNFFPPTLADVQFVNFAGGNYRLAPTSPYKNAGTDGKDVGVDFDALQAAIGPAVPSLFSATAIGTSEVQLTWTAVSGATSYEVERASTVGAFAPVLTTSATSVIDGGRSPNTSYVYRVRAVGSNGSSAFSTVDVATTIVFADASLSGVLIKAVHMTEIRTAVNAMRIAAALPPVTFTDSSLDGTIVKAVHITELRTALDYARSVIGLPGVSYTDPTVSAGVTTVKAAHMQQLRDATQ